MHIRPIFLPLALLTTLVACSAAGDPAQESEVEQEQVLVAAQQAAESIAVPAPDDTSVPVCDASQVQGLVGQVVDDARAEQARADAGASRVRMLKPGQMVTMDFDGERLNLEVDEHGTITALRCG